MDFKLKYIYHEIVVTISKIELLFLLIAILFVKIPIHRRTIMKITLKAREKNSSVV